MKPTAPASGIAQIARTSARCICALALAATLCGQAASAETVKYPDYNINAHCQSAHNSGTTKFKHDCEDREYAITILLRQQWGELNKSSSNFVSYCIDVNNLFNEAPSYLSLLQCVTNVRDAAD